MRQNHISNVNSRDAYFWSTHAGAELNLMLMVKGKRVGFEFKYSDAPGATRSMHSAIEDLKLGHLWIVYPGDRDYFLTDTISVIPLDQIEKIAPIIARYHRPGW